MAPRSGVIVTGCGRVRSRAGLVSRIDAWRLRPAQAAQRNDSNARAAAAIDAATSSSECAADTKPASNADGAR
jgi:hypothetical protein